MTPISRIASGAAAATMLAMSTSLALAHGTGAPHAHPHGAISNEALLGLALLAGTLAVAAVLFSKRKIVRQRDNRRDRRR